MQKMVTGTYFIDVARLGYSIFASYEKFPT